MKQQGIVREFRYSISPDFVTLSSRGSAAHRPPDICHIAQAVRSFLLFYDPQAKAEVATDEDMPAAEGAAYLRVITIVSNEDIVGCAVRVSSIPFHLVGTRIEGRGTPGPSRRAATPHRE